MLEVQRNSGQVLIIIGARCNYRKNMKVKRESFHAHFTDGVHLGEGDWKLRLINQSESTEEREERMKIELILAT